MDLWTMPIEITSDYGHIGNIFWCNSKPAPHPSYMMMRLVTYWGFTLIGQPEPGIMYGTEKPFTP
jgi:hypothetical protein